MAALDILAFWISLGCASGLTFYFPVSTAHERPIHTAVFALIACSFVLLSATRALPNLFHCTGPKQAGYSVLPLNDLAHGTGRAQQTDSAPRLRRHEAKIRVTVLTLVICVISLRLELYRRISKATECTVPSFEVWLPLLLAVFDGFWAQKHVKYEVEDKPDRNVYSSVRKSFESKLVAPRWRFVLPAFLVSYGCHALQDLWTSSNSTYICPIITGETKTVPAMQFATLLLDFSLAVIAYETSPKPDGTGLSGRRCAILWSAAFTAVSAIWMVVAVLIYTFRPEYRKWIMFIDPPLMFKSYLAIGGTITLFCFFCISTLHCITTYGVLEVSITLTALMTMIPSVQFLWTHKLPYPPISSTPWIASSFLFLFIGRFMHQRIRHALSGGNPVRLFRQLLLLAALCSLTSPLWMKHGYMHFHPIDLLIYEAKRAHSSYLETAGDTDSLATAVGRYQQRYQQNPPPGFDIWFEYAKNRSVLVVDEFDQIFDDLLPFNMVPPEDLRRQTWEMVSNPWNEISGITIRKGQAAVQENVLPTHRWMLEGVANLINQFAVHLPDMDLAFNLNDESRVAVPFDELTRLRTQATLLNRSGAKFWSSDRHEGWLPIPEEPYRETIFHGMSFRNTFRRFGSVGCPPSSLARSQPHIYSRSHLCYECMAPHSLGQFLANWSIAADVCHQPDMAHLHGLYLSPAAFKASYQIMPVFSQSKPHGFNDILYPSAWNYMDKVAYGPTKDLPDKPFGQKKNVLFWRGATSEGVSTGDGDGDGAWRGMTRQRLVHMTNNLTTTPHDRFTILLPDLHDHTKLAYQTLPGPAARDLGLHTDIAIVDHIARCGMRDCTHQEREFNLTVPSDFQAHWAHKFLFDLDGAGFSGRFLPFLHSRSLPFKTALFREWYDSRLRPWLHFVPIDARLTEVWSVLAYFGGLQGTMWGRPIHWDAHEEEAEMIAEQGREWAGKVLRKEDMEVYFFRLLLEWGRMTDDRRAELGFVL